MFTELHTRSREDLTEASNPALEYLLEKVQRKIQQQTGRNAWEHLIAEVNRRPGCQLLSLGSGPGGAEMNMARQFTVEYCFTCMDLNPDLMKLGERHSKQLGLNFRFLAADINKISLQPRSYDIVFAHAALHHFLALEHIFDQVNKSLKPGGKFIAYEVIPRNGMRLWDEANEVVQKLWQTLPDRLKYNRASSTPEFCPDYPNRAYGEESFECIRSEEIYPLLKKNFQIHVEVPALAFARRFVDTEFGPNYDLSDPQDRQIIDQLFELDESYLSCKQLKPETIFLVMGNEKTS